MTVTEPVERTLGQIAFEAYDKDRGGKTWDGKPTPPWEGLGDGVRQGWEAAGLAAVAQASSVRAHPERIYVYVAGPLNGSGHQHVNVRRAIAAGERLRLRGFYPFVPHLYAAQWAVLHDLGEEHWLHLDKGWLRKCDALLRLAGHSPGADEEVRLAESLGIPRYFDQGGGVAQLTADFAARMGHG